MHNAALWNKYRKQITKTASEECEQCIIFVLRISLSYYPLFTGWVTRNAVHCSLFDINQLAHLRSFSAFNRCLPAIGCILLRDTMNFVRWWQYTTSEILTSTILTRSFPFLLPFPPPPPIHCDNRNCDGIGARSKDSIA